jgi:Resolvase, N terminal domain
MLIGYMRVSTGEQSLDLQRDALGRAGCERVYDDVCSGRATERPGGACAGSQRRAAAHHDEAETQSGDDDDGCPR